MTRQGFLFRLFAFVLFAASFAWSAALPDLFPYNAYDGYNPGVRSVAMGGAGLCSARDASAVYFNPAGLYGGTNMSLISFNVRQSPKELADQYDILGGRALTFLGFMGGGMAVAWQPLSNIVSTGTAGSSVEVKVNKFSMSFSNNVSPAVNFGMNINYFSGFMGVTSCGAARISDANGYGIDWGVTYRAHPNITFAASLFNSPSSIPWSGFDSGDPPVIRRSGAMVQLSRLLTVSSEVELRKYSKARADGKKNIKIYHTGLEQSIADIIFLRGGIFGEDLNDNHKTGYSAGIGWYQDRVNVDISWQKEYPVLSSYDKYLETFSFSVNSPF